MANKTDPGALNVHNLNPQFLIEKIVRSKIYGCSFWKEKCFGLNSETLVDRAIELKYIGGTYGGTRKPTNFLCLILKMLQIQPEKEIIYELLKTKDYKYVSALAMFYLRLIGKSEEIYQCLEPFYSDNRKLILRKADGRFEIIHMDEYADALLTQEAYLDIVLTRIPKRMVFEESGVLEPRVSALEEDLIDEEEEIQAIQGEEQAENIGTSNINNSGENEQKIQNLNLEEKKENLLEKNSPSKRKDKKKHKRSRSKSRSHSHHHKHRKDKKHWRKVVKGKKSSRSREKDRKTHDNHDHEEIKDKNKNKNEGKVEEFSVEYWNKLRAEIGLKPLPNK